MEFLILPVRETAVDDFRKIYTGLKAAEYHEYANYLLDKVQAVDVDKNNPYVEIQGVTETKRREQLPGQLEMDLPKPKKYKIVGHYDDGETIESGAIEDQEAAQKFKKAMESMTGNRATFEIVGVEE